MLPRALHVELTETAVLSDEAQASALLSRLRATGVKVWLDDFGTGFSGLSHLRRVPVDGVKIDRSFVADVLRDPDDLALTTRDHRDGAFAGHHRGRRGRRAPRASSTCCASATATWARASGWAGR